MVTHLGHANARVDQSESLGVGVRDDLDEEVWLGLQLRGVSQGLVSGQVIDI